jgi:RNA polymerase sigma-70 factor (ECF subfamily)
MRYADDMPVTTSRRAPTEAEPAEQAPDVAPLVQRAAAGDEDAWRELAGRYGRRLYALARSRLRSHELAEDIAQSVFTTLAEKLRAGDYTEEGRFEPWLFRIAMNRIRDEIRKQQTADGAAGVLEAEARRGATVNTPEPDDLRRLRAAVATLDPAEQDVIALRHQAELPFAAIADLADEPLGTLLARHHRALRKLRTILQDQTP